MPNNLKELSETNKDNEENKKVIISSSFFKRYSI